MTIDTITSPDVLQRLRTATHERHTRLEDLLALAGPLPRARYVKVLQGFHAFVPGWEVQVQAALPASLHTWLAPRCRGALIAGDLRALGVAPAADPAPEVAGLALAASPARAFGSLYVMEGSTLGGQVITRGLAETLQLSPEHGAAYFHGHGRETGPMWKDFLAHLRAEVRDEAQAEEAAAGAADTFDALAALFARHLAGEPAPSPRPAAGA